MSAVAAARCVGAAVVGFAVVALLLSAGLGGAMDVGSDGQYVAVGLAALTAPLTGTVLGAWQGHAADVRPPLLGVVVAAVVSLLLGLLVFAANETVRDGFNTLQRVLVPVGVAVGGVAAARWFGRPRTH